MPLWPMVNFSLRYDETTICHFWGKEFWFAQFVSGSEKQVQDYQIRLFGGFFINILSSFRPIFSSKLNFKKIKGKNGGMEKSLFVLLFTLLVFPHACKICSELQRFWESWKSALMTVKTPSKWEMIDIIFKNCTF